MHTEPTTQQVLDWFAERRKNKQPRQAAPLNTQLDAYLKAAAVLHCFNPDTLKPLHADEAATAVSLLLHDHITKAAGGVYDGLYALKLPVRQKILKELGSRDNMRAALQANPERIRTELQVMFETYVNEGVITPTPEKMTYQQLVLYYQLLTWLDNFEPPQPSASQMLQMIQQKSVFAGFEHLVDKNFTGRQDELETLRHYTINRLSNYQRSKPVLSVSGPGGIGKSALVAQLLMENVNNVEEKKILFAYLAFDQPTLRIESPFTIILEAVSQLELQAPDQRVYFEDFRADIRDYRDGKGKLKSRDYVEETRGTRIDHNLQLEGELYQLFGDLLRKLTQNGKRTFILVLDTFEEVEYRDRESLNGFWYMLTTIHDSFPWFNVIIAGRSSIKERYIHLTFVEELKLERLQLEDSVTLLINLGVKNTALANDVAQKVGGNPLSLRLAANLLTSIQENPDELGDLNNLSLELDEQLIQGYLYSRILDHIHEEDVRTLAHPGMILRMVSPEVILHILAPVCKLAVENLAQATLLFEELKREHALVKTGPEGTLLYRQEIREAMVKLLQQDKYAQVQQIHRQAILYYQDFDDVASRAEEMYHRLALGQDEHNILNSRWKEGIETSVVQNIEEYPDEKKAWLASRMSVEVDRKVFENVATIEWEKNITRKVQTALARSFTDDALTLLAERADRTQASPLYALEAKAHLLENHPDKAAAVLETGIKAVTQSTNRGRLAELYWLLAQIELIRGNHQRADELLGRTEQAIAKAQSPIAVIHVLCHRLAIADNYDTKTKDERFALVVTLQQACKRLDFNFKFDDLFVIRMAKYYLGKNYPETKELLHKLADGEKPTNVAMLTNENLRGLDEFRENWEMGDTLEAYESLA